MIKNYVRYIVLMMLLTTYKPSFAMHTKLVQYLVGSTLISGVGYGVGKVAAKCDEYKREDAPENVQKWARKILAEKDIKNADSVPLKLGDGWRVAGGSFIQIDKEEAYSLEKCLVKKWPTQNDSKEKVLAEESLLHEGKHYNNGDFSKGYILLGLTYAPVFQALVNSNKRLTIPMVAFSAGSLLTYTRYQEVEADRFAFMNLSSIEKLEISKANRLRQAEIFENNLLTNPLRSKNNRLENIVRPMLSKKLHSLNQKALESSHDQNEKKRIDTQKKRLIKLADFIFDPKHPDFRRQVAIAQECLDKRKAERK